MAAQDVPTSGGGNVKPPSDGPTQEETQTATAAAAALASANLALLHKETERVSKKQKISVAKTTETIDGMLEEVRRARSHLAEISEPGDRRAVVDDLHASLNKANYASQVRNAEKTLGSCSVFAIIVNIVSPGSLSRCCLVFFFFFRGLTRCHRRPNLSVLSRARSRSRTSRWAPR